MDLFFHRGCFLRRNQVVTPGPLHLSRASTRSRVRLDTRKQRAATEVELRRCNYTSGRVKCFWSIPSQLLLRGELAEHQGRREEGGWRREEGGGRPGGFGNLVEGEKKYPVLRVSHVRLA